MLGSWDIWGDRFSFFYFITTANFTSLIFCIHTGFSCPDHQITLIYALFMGCIYFFWCLEGFGKFWSSGTIVNWVDYVMVGDLLLSWKISSDMTNFSDSDRDPSWNTSWDTSLGCLLYSCCLYATVMCCFVLGFYVWFEAKPCPIFFHAHFLLSNMLFLYGIYTFWIRICSICLLFKLVCS